MSYFLLLAVSLGPGLAWLWYFYRQDKYHPEPRSLVGKAFIAGMLAVFPAALFELPFRGLISEPTSLISLALAMIFVVGLPEELVKYFAVKRSVYHHPEFNEPVDGIIYAVGVGLGFAALENMFYALSFGIAIAPLRALVACLAHASFSGILGYYLGLAKFSQDHERALAIRGLVSAIILHALYDFFILAPGLPSYLSLVLLGGAYQFLRIKIREMRQVAL